MAGIARIRRARCNAYWWNPETGEAARWGEWLRRYYYRHPHACPLNRLKELR